MSKASSSPSNKSLPMYKALVGIGVFCGLLIAITYEGTFSRISNNRAEALQKAIFSVLPSVDSIQPFTRTIDNIFLKEDAEGEKIYAGYDKQGKLIGFAIEASGMGYADVITVLYGYSPEKEAIVGMRVLQSKETPGLGDKIEKESAFLKNFDRLDVSLVEDKSSLQNRIKTVKTGTKVNAWEIDGITGATISSKAIGELLAASSEKWIPMIGRDLSIFESAGFRRTEAEVVERLETISE